MLSLVQIPDGQSSGQIKDYQPFSRAHQIAQEASKALPRASPSITMPHTEHGLHDPIL